MKAFLMYPGRDFDAEADLPDGADALVEDLGLRTLFEAMSGGDEFLYEVAERAVLTSLDDPQAIGYRQHVLRDCLDRADVVREMYDVAVEAVLGSKKIYRGIFSQLTGLGPALVHGGAAAVRGPAAATARRSPTSMRRASGPRASPPCSRPWPPNWATTTSRPSTIT